MPDREKVIKGLDICANGGGCKDGIPNPLCPYSSVVGCDLNQILLDALTLLKEQGAVTIKKTKEHGFGVYGGICPKCRNWIQSAHSFCGFCGQAVKWE